MSYFIFAGVLECGQQFELEGEEARHVLKSRRMRSGEHFLIQDQNAQRFDAVLKSSGRDSLSFVPESSVAVPQASVYVLKYYKPCPRKRHSTGSCKKRQNLESAGWIFFAEIIHRILFIFHSRNGTLAAGNGLSSKRLNNADGSIHPIFSGMRI